MFDLTNFIPQVAAAKTALIVGAVVALFSGGLYCGYQIGSKALPEAEKAQQIDFTKTLQKRWEITDNFVPVYIDRIQKVKGDTQQLLTQVPVYVPNSCTLPPSVRVFHDSATQGHLPVTQQDNDGATEAPQGTPRLW